MLHSCPISAKIALIEGGDFRVYVKNEAGQWLFQEYEGKAVTVSFASVGVQMSMSDIYEAVVFETEQREGN